MTRKELVEMIGSEEQAELAIDILLKNTNEHFVQIAFFRELKKIEKEIESLVMEGIIYVSNGCLNVNWNSGNNRQKCQSASKLLCKDKCLRSMNCVRLK